MDGEKTLAKRDKSTFKANFTASLQIWHKNVIANDQSILFGIAQTLANTTYTHAISPTLNFVISSVTSQLSQETSTSASPSPKTKKTSHKETQARRNAAQAQAKALRDRLDALEAKIKPLYSQKKQIDDIEKHNKAKQIKPYLTETQQQERIKLYQRIDELLVQKVELCQGLIEEHVMRRLDIIFLFMIAVYKQNISITKGSTDRQHGDGENGNAACHSSLIPHPVITPLTSQASLFYNPIRQYSAYQFFFGCEAQNLSLNEDKLKHCYLYDLLNMTTELPRVVNDFDGHMEGKWVQSNAVQSLIQVINQVAIGELTPIEGINRYADIMYLFFNHMEYKLLSPEQTYTAVQTPQSFSLIKQYQAHGTFAMFSRKENSDGTSSHQIDSAYLYHMLKLNSITLSPLAKNVPLFIEQQILNIQQEIWQQPSKFTDHLEQKKQPINTSKTNPPQKASSSDDESDDEAQLTPTI